MELIIGIILVYLVVRFINDDGTALRGCRDFIVVPILLFSFFGPIGPIIYFLYYFFKGRL